MKKFIPLSLIALAFSSLSLTSCKIVSDTDSKLTILEEVRQAPGKHSEERSWIDWHDRKN